MMCNQLEVQDHWFMHRYYTTGVVSMVHAWWGAFKLQCPVLLCSCSCVWPLNVMYVHRELGTKHIHKTSTFISRLCLYLSLYICTCPELLYNTLYLLSVEAGQLPTAQRETTQTGSLMTPLQSLSWFLKNSDAALVHHIPNFGKYLNQGESGRLPHGWGEEGRGLYCWVGWAEGGEAQI